jgi:O-antigen/teichoic acid export membrane protein
MSISKILSGSLLKNSASILLTRMSLSFSSLGITIVIARHLGVDQLGQFSIAMGLCTIFQFISILGYDTIVIREIAKDQQKGSWLISHGILLGILSSAVCALLMILIGKILNYPPSVMKSVYISTAVLFPSFLNFLVEMVFIGLKKAKYTFYTAIVRELVWLILGAWWVGISKDVNTAIWAFVTSRIVGMILFSIFLKIEGINWWKSFQWLGLKKLTGLIPTFLLINVLSNILLEIDVILLSRMVPIADVGFYSVTKKILRVSFSLIFSMVTAMFPIIVETVNKNAEKVFTCFKRLSLRIFIVSGVITLMVCILARTLVLFFLGSSFIPSVNFVQVLIWKIIPLGLSFLWSRFLIAANRQDKDVIALIISLPLFLVLGILFVKKWGTVGMAYADVLTLTVLAFIHLYFVNRNIFHCGEKA